jgi:hypothetical protein
VACGQSSGGGSPAPERGGGDGGERWRVWASALPVWVLQRERGRERMGSGVEA